MSIFDIDLLNSYGKEIKRIKLLGIKNSEKSKTDPPYNSTLYSLIVLYTDNSKELVECDAKEFQRKFIHYIEI